MAIDTREKRFSMLNFGDGSYSHVGFEADGSIDLDDRQHLLDCYSGIAFAAIVLALDVGGLVSIVNAQLDTVLISNNQLYNLSTVDDQLEAIELVDALL